MGRFAKGILFPAEGGRGGTKQYGVTKTKQLTEIIVHHWYMDCMVLITELI